MPPESHHATYISAFSTCHALVATRVLALLSLPVSTCAEQALKEKAGRITRADTAAVCVEALSSPAAGGVTIAISGQPLTGDYEAQLKELFSGTVKDTA